MHPKKNRCITFWGGWKYRGLETNAMTLRRKSVILLHFHYAAEHFCATVIFDVNELFHQNIVLYCIVSQKIVGVCIFAFRMYDN